MWANLTSFLDKLQHNTYPPFTTGIFLLLLMIWWLYENKDKNVDYNVENKEETRMRYYFEKEYNSKNIGLHIPLYL